MCVCKKCGAKMQQEDKFCSNCGAPIEESSRNTNKILDEFKKVFKGMLLNPIDTISNIGNIISKKTSIILSISIAIFYAILTLLIVKRSLSGLGKFDFFGLTIKIPYAKIFFLIIAIIMIAYIILFLIMSLIGVIVVKGKNNMEGIWKVAVVSLIPYVYANIATMLISLVSGTIALICINAGLIMVSICLYMGLKNAIKLQGDKCIYCVAISEVLTKGIMIFIIIKIIFFIKESIIRSFGF